MSEINPDEVFDITIIGGGPTGQYAAYYAGLRGMKTLVIDSLDQLGGQLTALYPEKYIFDVAGFPKVYAKDLVAALTEQMMQYNPTLALYHKVVNLVSTDSGITIDTEQGDTYHTKSILITAGVGAFAPRRVTAPGVEKFEDKGVFYFVKDKNSLRDKRLLIVGGGDSAFDWSLNLHGHASKITQIHRSDRFKAHEDSINKVQEIGIDFRTFHELKEIHGEDQVTGVTLFDNRTKEEFHLEVDAVILNLGFLSNLGPIKEWNLELLGNSLKVNSRMETNIPGVYAAGDICTYDGKLKLIATGFGEAAIAVNHAKHYVDPTAKVNPGHSSESVPEKKH